MGICMSSNNEEAEQKKKSQQIDKQLEEDSKRLRKECKILLLGACTTAEPALMSVMLIALHLGSGESGKSTIVKQMKIIHLKGYSEDELYNYRPTVFKNLVECAKAVITAMQQFDIEPQEDGNKKHADFLLEYQAESGPQAHIDPQVGVAVQAIWNDPAKAQLMEHQTEFYLMDSAE
jgi:guanine nucleotide-binding protein G(i) subunit alpha